MQAGIQTNQIIGCLFVLLICEGKPHTVIANLLHVTSNLAEDRKGKGTLGEKHPRVREPVRVKDRRVEQVSITPDSIKLSKDMGILALSIAQCVFKKELHLD